MFLQGTLGGNFDIFAASGESTAWVLVWKTRSRPIGVRVCLVAQFNFFSTAFVPRVWTMVVFCKEGSGREPQLITPENEGGDETNCSSPPILPSPMILMVLLDLVDLLDLLDRQVRLDHRQDGLQLHHLLVTAKD